jgi:phosphoribosyl-ATP pyrophosphohydrolase
MIEQLYEQIKLLNQKEPKDLIAKGLKLCEESGELAAEILKLKGLKSTREVRSTINRNIVLEGADCLFILFQILSENNVSISAIENALKNKINKRNIKLNQKKRLTSTKKHVK